jgi:hypothetical protein
MLISRDEVIASFSDRVIDRLIVKTGLPRDIDRPRLRTAVRAAVTRYAETAREPTANKVRAEIETLHRVLQSADMRKRPRRWPPCQQQREN